MTKHQGIFLNKKVYKPSTFLFRLFCTIDDQNDTCYNFMMASICELNCSVYEIFMNLFLNYF